MSGRWVRYLTYSVPIAALWSMCYYPHSWANEGRERIGSLCEVLQLTGGRARIQTSGSGLLLGSHAALRSVANHIPGLSSPCKCLSRKKAQWLQLNPELSRAPWGPQSLITNDMGSASCSEDATAPFCQIWLKMPSAFRRGPLTLGLGAW